MKGEKKRKSWVIILENRLTKNRVAIKIIMIRFCDFLKNQKAFHIRKENKTAPIIPAWKCGMGRVASVYVY